MMGTVELVALAIQAGIRLARASRRFRIRSLLEGLDSFDFQEARRDPATETPRGLT